MFPSVTLGPNFRTFLKVPAKCAVPKSRHYNGSTCEVAGNLWHVWRFEDPQGHSHIWIGQVDAKGKITKARALVTSPDYDSEDPRLFTLENGAPRLMWSKVRDTRHNHGSWHVFTMLSHLDPLTLEVKSSEELILPGIRNRYCEKNWTPCPDGSWLYDIQAGLSVDPRGRLIRNRPFNYIWGSFSGSSPCIPWPERKSWLMVFHGFLPHPRRDKRYYFGFAEIDPATHRVLNLSQAPLVFASDDDPSITCPRCAVYDPCCVFPAGLVRQPDGRWLVSGGVHDSRDAWWSFSDADLALVPLRQALARKCLLAVPGAIPPSGYVMVRLVCKFPIAENGGTYLPGDVFLTYPSRAKALGNLIQIL